MPRPNLPLVTLAVILAAAAPAAAAVGVEYAPGTQTLSLDVPAGVTPVLWELASPPRLVIEVPGAAPDAPRTEGFERGFVRQLAVLGVPGATRVQLSLSRPLQGAWTAALVDGRLRLTLRARQAAAAAPGASPAARTGVAPARSNVARLGAVRYDARAGVVSLPLTSRVKPRFERAEDPPRLIVDLPGTTASAPQAQTFAAELFQRITTTQLTPSVTRVELTFARPYTGNWALKQTGARLDLVFPRQAVTAPAAGLALSGRVFHINRATPLAGVKAVIKGRQVLTDREGRFRFSGLPAGRHRLVLHARGFAPQAFAVQTPEAEERRYTLVPTLD